MSDTPDVLENFSNQPVPEEQSVRWVSLALVVIAIFISLPAYIQGIQLGHALGLYGSLRAFGTGSVLLMAVGICCAIVGARTRLSTYMIIRHAFGRRGGIFVNLIFSITIFGWFGVVVAEFSQAVIKSLELLNFHASGGLTVYNLLGSLLMISTAIFGFRGLNVLSNIVTPLLILALGAIIYLSLQKMDFATISMSHPHSMEMGNAVSSVVGSMIVAMVIFPDYSRYTRSVKHAVAGVVASISLLPVFFMTAAISGIATGETQLVPAVISLGLGMAGLLVIIFAAWTTNASNLYVTTLSLSTVFEGRKGWHITLGCGALGFLVAVAGLSNYLIPFLITLGVCLPPVGSIYVLHYFLFSGQNYDGRGLEETPAVCPAAFFAWIAASAVGYLSVTGLWTLTGIATCDSIIASALIYYLLKKLSHLDPVS